MKLVFASVDEAKAREYLRVRRLAEISCKGLAGYVLYQRGGGHWSWASTASPIYRRIVGQGEADRAFRRLAGISNVEIY